MDLRVELSWNRSRSVRHRHPGRATVCWSHEAACTAREQHHSIQLPDVIGIDGLCIRHSGTIFPHEHGHSLQREPHATSFQIRAVQSRRYGNSGCGKHLIEVLMGFSFACVRDVALTRRNVGNSSAMSDLLQQTTTMNNSTSGYASSSARSASFPPVDLAATMAPFATERQSFQLDAMEKRHLEQKLMNFQLEKEQVRGYRHGNACACTGGHRWMMHDAALFFTQVEAKLIKLEQTGLKTMSARSEKQRLDDRIHSLAQDISKLKLTLR